MSRRTLTLALLSLFVARLVQACQCDDRPTVRAAAARSDVVAVGRISRVTRAAGFKIGETRLENPVVATMIVDASWKREARTLEIIGGFSDCDFTEFAVGHRYLVFAVSEIPGVGNHDTAVWAPRCWPTQRRDSSWTILPELGEPMFRSKTLLDPGVKTSTEPDRVSRTKRGVVAGVLALAILVGISALVLFRK